MVGLAQVGSAVLLYSCRFITVYALLVFGYIYISGRYQHKLTPKDQMNYYYLFQFFQYFNSFGLNISCESLHSKSFLFILVEQRSRILFVSAAIVFASILFSFRGFVSSLFSLVSIRGNHKIILLFITQSQLKHAKRAHNSLRITVRGRSRK